MSRHVSTGDGIDERQAQWAEECPDVDTVGMALLGRMRALTLMVRPQIEAVFANYGLESGEFGVLATLLRSGPPYRLRPTELYRQLMISSGGMTDRLARLTKLGHVVRLAAPGDGRSLLVQLTEEGRKVADAAFREDMLLESHLLTVLDQRQRAQLAGLLRELLCNLEANKNTIGRTAG